MLEDLKKKVFNANQDLWELSVCPFSWINVSAMDPQTRLAVFAPDGGALTAGDLVVMDLDGNVLEGKEKPVCDAAVHLALYREFPQISSIAHPYSRWAAIFAQLGLNIPTFGTIHADMFGADIPTTEVLPLEALEDPGNLQIAEAILNVFRTAGMDPLDVPGVLVSCHGAYVFGGNTSAAVTNAQVLDEIALLAYHTMQMDPGIRPMQFRRKSR